MIWHIIERCKRVSKAKPIIATSTRKADDPLERITTECRISCYRGSADDVLTRYYKCAEEFGVDPIVRITGDCPLVDSDTINGIIRIYNETRFDYVRTGLSYPEGINVEVFSFESLARAFREATLTSEREHVTPYIWKNPSKFAIQNIEFQTDFTDYRLVVDYKEDLLFIEKIYEQLFAKNSFFGFTDVIHLLKNDAALLKEMPAPKRLEGYYLSLKQDRV